MTISDLILKDWLTSVSNDHHSYCRAFVKNNFLFQSVIIYVPMPKLKQFQKVQTRLVRELEKKFSGKHVVFVGERKILPKPTRKTRTKNKQKRPRSRTLTSVYDAILEDLVYPAEIVGKRIRIRTDGKQLTKVHLDKLQQTTIEHKVCCILQLGCF